MPIVCPHKLCKINLPTKKDTVPTVSFFCIERQGNGRQNDKIDRSNKRQSNKGTEDRGMEDKVTKELRITRMSRIRDKDLRNSRNS